MKSFGELISLAAETKPTSYDAYFAAICSFLTPKELSNIIKQLSCSCLNCIQPSCSKPQEKRSSSSSCNYWANAALVGEAFFTNYLKGKDLRVLVEKKDMIWDDERFLIEQVEFNIGDVQRTYYTVWFDGCIVPAGESINDPEKDIQESIELMNHLLIVISKCSGNVRIKSIFNLETSCFLELEPTLLDAIYTLLAPKERVAELNLKPKNNRKERIEG